MPEVNLEFGRETCGNLEVSGAREWLVTNGLGGYASGTLAGLLSRRYHGLLIAALRPPTDRSLLVGKLDETAEYDGNLYPLHANRYADGRVEPSGYVHIERFHLEGTVPVWTFALADALLEKRIWMEHGRNTTYVLYTLARGSGSVALQVDALVHNRDHHHLAPSTHPDLDVVGVPGGIRVSGAGGPVVLLICERASARATGDWLPEFYLSVEKMRGYEALDAELRAGHFDLSLGIGESAAFILTAEADADRDADAAYTRRAAYEQALVPRTDLFAGPWELRQLAVAADQFIVGRALPGGGAGKSVIAGYPWFTDWGRDTMICLPGLTLTTGRPEIARQLLSTFARHVDRGMLPNRFMDEGGVREHNTIDATMWYFEAIRAYHARTGDDELLADLFPVLQDIVDWHLRGTRYNIHVDPTDGLVYGGEAGVQLTWMDAKVGDIVPTPRIGKPVEISALWYNGLMSMIAFATRLGRPVDRYRELAARARAGFARFWNADAGYLFDVLDGPAGHEADLRPNQLFAVSLPHSPLDPGRQKAVVDACARRLLTSYGLRSLDRGEEGYCALYIGDRVARDCAYHQGTVWSWLIGPFVLSHLRVYRDPALARTFLRPLLGQLRDHGIGSISEIFDGEAPFQPHGCIAQGWGVAETLRAWEATLWVEAGEASRLFS